jgi:hypothetical protein
MTASYRVSLRNDVVGMSSASRMRPLLGFGKIQRLVVMAERRRAPQCHADPTGHDASSGHLS